MTDSEENVRKLRYFTVRAHSQKKKALRLFRRCGKKKTARAP
jgi:hypothetical protein